MLGRQIRNQGILKSYINISHLNHNKNLQRIQNIGNINNKQIRLLSKYSFCSSQNLNTITEETYQSIQWQIKQLSFAKNKETLIVKEVLSKINQLDSQIVQYLFDFMIENSFSKHTFIQVLSNELFNSYNMNDLEIKQAQNLFVQTSNPKKINEYEDILTFLKNDESQISTQLRKKLNIHSFQKDLNKVLIEQKDNVELTQIIEWISQLQNIDKSIEMNGVLNEKAYEDLYDLSLNEWFDLLKVYKINGSIDIELLTEMDKVISKNNDEIFSQTDLFVKYMSLCSTKDFKPAQISEYEKHLKQIILEQKKIVCPLYLENIQYINRQFVQGIFDDLIKVTDIKQIEQSIPSKDILSSFGLIPDPYLKLKNLIAQKNNTEIANYIRQKFEVSLTKENSLQIEELFSITKYVYDTKMMQRNSDAKRLNLPHIIQPDEEQIIQQLFVIVNTFMKEKIYKKANSLKQFLEVSCISFFMGFVKQQKECYENISPQYLKQFHSVYILPLIIEFGKINNQLLIDLIPVYAEYLNNKYIKRNQLSFDEAVELMRSLIQVKDCYTEQNAKYYNKQFIYGMKTISRLIINTFQLRIYANYKDIKSNKKLYENFFMEQKDTKWQSQKEKIEIAMDLSEQEINQLLEIYNLANQMNIGSKEFYDSMEELILQYYDKFSLKQQALSAYVLSTLDPSNQHIEKKVEETILSNTKYTLDQAVQFLGYLTARYSLNEDLWKNLINSLQNEDKEGRIISNLSEEYKLSLYLTRECLLLEQPHITFPLSDKTVEHLAQVFQKNQFDLANRQTAFTEAIQYFLDRMGYYYEVNQKASIFTYQFSKLDQNNLIVILDKWAFIGDTKNQRSNFSIMVRMLTKKGYKLKIFNVYDWAGKEKRSEKITYFRSKVKGMSFDPEKQKKKTYFNF